MAEGPLGASVVAEPDVVAGTSQDERWGDVRQVDNPHHVVALDAVHEEHGWLTAGVRVLKSAGDAPHREDVSVFGLDLVRRD